MSIVISATLVKINLFSTHNKKYKGYPYTPVKSMAVRYTRRTPP